MPVEDDDDDTETGFINQLPNGDVEIKFYGMHPFVMEPESAIRFGALLCKRAGCEIQFRQGSMKVRFPRGFDFGNENSVAERIN